MRRHVGIGAVLLALSAAGWACGGEPPCAAPGPPCLPGRLGPAGGWHPYGGGLLHWWNPDWFPRSGTPDDYCRKPLPRFGWPPYPPYYLYGPVGRCCPGSQGP
jgi:hypothetical protein